jgi:molybdopterin/thiamine biosynthesis adenylyltransferase
MKRIAVIGAGGINSWVVKHLNEISEIFDKKQLFYVKLFDKDEVEEKNLLRNNQNFEVKDLMQQKAIVLGKRYNFDYSSVFIDETNIEMLKNFDDIIMGVDNNVTRRLIYEFALANNIYLLDLKAQGTAMAFVVLDKTKNIEYYDKLFFNNKESMERRGSCQLTEDITNDHIQNANKIIAMFGIYGIYMKHLRDEEPAMNDWKIIY